MLGIKTIKRNKIMQFQNKNQKEIKLSDLDNTQLLKLHLYDNKKYEEVIKLSEKLI